MNENIQKMKLEDIMGERFGDVLIIFQIRSINQ